MQGEMIRSNSLFLGSCNELLVILFYLSMGYIFIVNLNYMLLHRLEVFTAAIMPDKGSQPFGSEEVLY